MGAKILSETAISMNQLQEELTVIKKRDKELSFRSAKTDEYLQQFSDLEPKKAKDLFHKIEKLEIPRLKESHIIKIVDLAPKSIDGLKVILQGYTITITNDNMKKIVELVTEASGK